MSGARQLRADVRAFLRHIEDVRNLSPHTVRAYAGDLDELVVGLRQLGVQRTRDIDLFALRRYLTTLRDRRLAARSTARKISSVRALFGWLAEAGRIPANPAASLRLPSAPATCRAC